MMRRWICSVLLLSAAFILPIVPTGAQTPPQPLPVILAGSPEDKALRAVENEPDPAKRVILLEQFMRDFPAMDRSPEVNEMLVFVYQQLKNQAKVIVYSEKVLAVRPDSLQILPLIIDALLGQQGPYDRAFELAKHYQKLIQNPDAGIGGRPISESDRTRMQAEAKSLLDAARQQVEYSTMQSAYQETNPDKKIATLENFTKEFPDSPQICSAYTLLALAYLRKQNVAQSASSAGNCLKVDPNNLDMLVLLADLQVEDKAKVKQTAELVAKAVSLADALEGKPVPEGQDEADWNKRKNYLRGTAHGLKGYLDLKAGLYSKSIPDLEIAQKLLGEDSATLYRLGFALAKVRRTREAEMYLSRAAKMSGPFQDAARRALSELNR